MASSSRGAVGRDGVTSARRPHRKVRTGCYECKKRRVKCAGERPSCSYCSRHQVVCIYPPTVGANNHEATSSLNLGLSTRTSSPSTQNTIELEETSDKESVSLSLADLDLYHHWILTASTSILQCPSIDGIWQSTIPLIGHKFPFVLYGILSVSALHLMCISEHPSQQEKYFRLAAEQNSKALSGFRSAITKASSVSHSSGKVERDMVALSTALLASSSLTFLSVLCLNGPMSIAHTKDETESDRLRRQLGEDWIPIIRGVSVVVSPFHSYMMQGNLAALLNIGDWDEIDPSSSEWLARNKELRIHKAIREDEEYLQAVSQAIGDSDMNSADKVLYTSTLNLLLKTFYFIQRFSITDVEDESNQSWGYNRSNSGPTLWLVSVPEDFFSKLYERNTFALCVWASFGLLLYRLRRYWFWKGWGSSIISSVSEQLKLLHEKQSTGQDHGFEHGLSSSTFDRIPDQLLQSIQDISRKVSGQIE